jgi:hypothetical protein
MIVHFIASKGSIEKYIGNYRQIIEIIRGLGHEIARDWVEREYNLQKKNGTHSSINWQEVAEENTTALARADIVIADASAKSFSTGFQVANAIQQKKPVLILADDGSLKDTFASGIKSDFINIAEYTNENLKDIICDFMVNNEIDNKDLRFNFFIDRKIHNYLRWASYKTGKNKSEILRELVIREIDNKD